MMAPMDRSWTVDTELAAAHSRLTASIEADMSLWRAIAEARQSGDDRQMHLALDLYIRRGDHRWGGAE